MSVVCWIWYILKNLAPTGRVLIPPQYQSLVYKNNAQICQHFGKCYIQAHGALKGTITIVPYHPYCRRLERDHPR